MKAGSEVYRDIQQRIQAAEDHLESIRAQLKDTSQRLEANRARESQDLTQLAKIRFDELEGDRVVQGLDSADHEVLTLLEHKRSAQADVERRFDETQGDRRTIEAERERLRAALDAALARYETALQEVQTQLEASESYLFQRARTERAYAQSHHAAEKAAQAQADRELKGRPYEDSKLFSYLWKRRYGYPEYRANLMTRALDQWVAKLCKYDNARRDYAMLLEIPVRLKAYAEELHAVAESEARKLDNFEAEARTTAGIPSIQDDIESREADLASCEETLAGAETQLSSLRAERARYDGDEDDYTRQAVAVLASHMSREPVASLHADAVRSQTPSDDAIVTNIANLRSERDDLEPQLSDQREAQDKALKALKSLEQVRGAFRRKSYDAEGSVFEDRPRTSSLLKGLLRGALVVTEVLADLKAQQRFERPAGGGWRTGGWSWGSHGGGGRRSGGVRSSGGRSGGFRTVDRF